MSFIVGDKRRKNVQYILYFVYVGANSVFQHMYSEFNLF